MKPYLKYPGAKTRVAAQIKRYFPKAERLIEPFVGSGAMFLSTRHSRYLLADTNAAIINAHQVVAANPGELLDRLDQLFVPENNTEERYKEIVKAFNTEDLDAITKAAYTVWINRHCFNGQWRVNSSGHFNSSFGYCGIFNGPSRSPKIPVTEIVGFYEKCQRCEVEIHCQDFAVTMAEAGQGDIVYADPPYTPLGTTANFTAYSNEFGPAEHYRLVECAREAMERGAVVFISNHDCPEARALYPDAQIIDGLLVKRNISGDATARKWVSELLAVYSQKPIPVYKQMFMFPEMEKAV